MNTREALRALVEAEAFPEQALRWLLDNWDECANVLLQTLARTARDSGEASDAALQQAAAIFFLMAEKREKRALPLLLALIRAPECADIIFGGNAQEELPRLIVSLFDHDVAPLVALAQDARADMDGRMAVFAALAGIALLDEKPGKPARTAIEAFLEGVGREAHPGDSVFWGGWGICAAIIGLERLRPEIDQACEDMRIDAAFLTREDFASMFERMRTDPTGAETLASEDRKSTRLNSSH